MRTKAVVRRCSVKKLFLKLSQNLQENTCARVSFFIKCLWPPACNSIKKETLTQVFSCEPWESSRNNFFIEHLRWLLQCVIVFFFTFVHQDSHPAQFWKIKNKTLFHRKPLSFPKIGFHLKAKSLQLYLK